MPASLSSRVVERLVQAEACEPNVHFRDDLRIARLTVAYAARGEAVLCSPHVLASYMTLGLHPEKVWPAILARQEALGLREEVSGAAGFAQTKPPKKPPQSVKLWFEKTNAARATNSRGAMQSVLHEPTISVPMAAPSIAALSTNSGDSGSAKERPFFKREELQEFFETCSSDLVRHPELRTMHGMWIAAGKPFGSEIQFFKAIKHYCEGAPHGGYKSESAVRANIRRAEAKGFLEIAYRDPDRGTHHIWIRRRTDEDRGLYRRVTTHRLSIPLLLKWRAQHHKVREMPPRKPDPPPTSPKPPAHAAPQPQRKTAEAREPLKITRDVRKTIGDLFVQSKKSGKGDDEAIEQVCAELSSAQFFLAASEVRLQLKIWQSKHGSLDPPQNAREQWAGPPKCRECHTALVQNTGPGPRLICPQCRSAT